MSVKRLLSVLAMSAVGCVGVGCDEHPRSGQVENERVTEAPEQGDQRTEKSAQAGAVGSELAAQTEEPMEQCIEVVEQVASCTSSQPFNEAITGQQEELSTEKLSSLAHQWQEPGTVRQSCESLLQSETNNPFRDTEKLNSLVESAGQECPDFAEALIQSGAVNIISDIEL